MPIAATSAWFYTNCLTISGLRVCRIEDLGCRKGSSIKVKFKSMQVRPNSFVDTMPDHVSISTFETIDVGPGAASPTGRSSSGGAMLKWVCHYLKSSSHRHAPPQSHATRDGIWLQPRHSCVIRPRHYAPRRRVLLGWEEDQMEHGEQEEFSRRRGRATIPGIGLTLSIQHTNQS